LRRSPQSIVHSPQSGFKNAMEQTEDSGLRTLDLLQTACRAGAIVLLVGFWFDGGLFKLATASVFWILIELGNAKNRMI
jgi:hypothetical protein